MNEMEASALETLSHGRASHSQSNFSNLLTAKDGQTREDLLRLLETLQEDSRRQARSLLVLETQNQDRDRRVSDLHGRIIEIEADIKRFMHWGVISLIAFVANQMLRH